MSRYLISLLFFLVVSFSTYSQILNPIKWETSVVKDTEAEYTLIAKAVIEPTWHLYSQNVPENGPNPTLFTFYTNEDFELIGNTTEEEGHTVFDEVFKMEIKYFDNQTTFKQRIKVFNEKLSGVNGEVEYMACNDKQCTPPTTKDLVFNLDKVTSGNIAKPDNAEENDAVGKTPVTTNDKDVSDLKKIKKKETKRSLWGIFIVSFLFGFTAIFTPCVFPMIPMTVSFFTKQSKNKAKGLRNAVVYGISIIIIYVLLGTFVTAIFGASALNELATNVWFNLIFFLLLVVFAVSFLGAFELQLPSSWATKVDAQADKGGYIGIFFMALALAIVSFSCTGPIVGYILVEAATKGGIAPIIGMLGFSTSIALVFAIFAAFPGWLNSLPKSGGWLNTVKVVLGFLELALAFKFLSQADLVLQLHWLEREVFIAIWIAIFGALAMYLFGKIQLPHDSPLTHISVGRLSLALLVSAFTIYMIPGLWGAPLNLISAFPPPIEYSESPYGVGYSKMGGGGIAHSDELPDGGHLLAPHDILAFNDYEKGMAYAKKAGKPAMLDFTGWACVNCRRMEQNVWVKPKILDILKNKVVLISLYVDDQRTLTDGEDKSSKLRPGKKLKNIGQKWSEFQTIRYKANTQPFYVLINHEEENLTEPVGYTPDVDEYYAWLEKGILNFERDR
ncbi:MAG: thiol:disulfide interchange protein [Flavobacteriales bacterium]|nr:MAG: thiol:disulfide interchange protein [Flavobacteriales bacterium]